MLDNIRGNTGGICTPNALVASRKLLPVLIEVVGVKFPFIVLVRWGMPLDEVPPAIVEKPGPPEVRSVAPVQ